ncbi:hypothetical protein Acr_00g0014920 [Actinidia rufa]|uniref:Uncharacterized protein n=1 Tax=Actinidia rufa TaxID=165716 RepID=A0A7J0DBU8_9ERIC|nr:hypothetical protein Acr_00g0014920 [Actinidia rufa]
MILEFCPQSLSTAKMGLRQWEGLMVIPWKIVNRLSMVELDFYLPRSHLMDICLMIESLIDHNGYLLDDYCIQYLEATIIEGLPNRAQMSLMAG